MLTTGELTEVQAGMRPAGLVKTITFDGGITSGKLSTKAALTTTLTGANNDMVFTADIAGTAGNAITVQYRDPAVTIARPIQVATSGTTITVDLATADLTVATQTLTSDATAPASGDTVTIGSTVYTARTALSTGPTVAFEVLIGGSAAVFLDNLKSAINLTGTIGTDYSTGTTIHPTVTATTNTNTTQVVEAKTGGTAGNAIASTETSAHLSWGAATLAGGLNAGQIISLASEVKTAIEANAEAAALVDITNSGGDTGAGVVTAMAATALSGGSDGKVPLFTVTGSILCSLRGYCATSLTGTSATLVHGVTGTTNMLIPILTSTNITVGKGIDSTSAVVARGTALTKTPLWYVQDEAIFATTATAATTAGKIHYVLDYIALTNGATVV